MVRRIVVNIDTQDIALARGFYNNILGLDVLMDHGWIATHGVSNSKMDIQISFASEGGAGTPTLDISIEVDNLEEIYSRVKVAGFPIECSPTDESWGVHRFYVRDPF